MTTTAKISVVEPNPTHSNEERERKSQSVSTDPRERSQFVSVGKDNWKSMSTPSDIGDMMDAMNGIEEMSSYRGPIDLMSDIMIINDPLADHAASQNVQVLDVPDLHKDLLKPNPRLLDDMEPIVERYDALIKTFDELIENTEYSLKQAVSQYEAKSLADQLEALKYGKLEAIQNWQKANVYWEEQKLREEAAKEKEEDLDL